MDPGWAAAPLTKDTAEKARTKQLVSRALLSGAFLPYHTAPVAPWFTVIIGLDVVLVTSWPASVPTRRQLRYYQDWLPMLAGLAAIALGVGLGIPNSMAYEPWLHATYLKEHTDVLPGWDPRLAADSGILHFAEGSSVDVAGSAGFHYWPHTYCAAPIVDNTTDDGDAIGFFAVGMDCCDSRGGFACDDAEDSEARSGIRVNSHLLSHFSTLRGAADFYRRAAKMAAAANGRGVKEPPVFVAWTKDARSLARSAWWTATGIYVACFVSAGGCCALSCFLLWRAMVKQR